MTILTDPQRQALAQALAMPVPGDDLSSCDPLFDFAAWCGRTDSLDMAIGAVVGVLPPLRPTFLDIARYLLALDTAHRAAVQAERDRILAAADAFVGAKADALHDTCTEYNEGAMDSAVQLRDAIAALRQGAA